MNEYLQTEPIENDEEDFEECVEEVKPIKRIDTDIANSINVTNLGIEIQSIDSSLRECEEILFEILEKIKNMDCKIINKNQLKEAYFG
jgi:hypothetical protein